MLKSQIKILEDNLNERESIITNNIAYDICKVRYETVVKQMETIELALINAKSDHVKTMTELNHKIDSLEKAKHLILNNTHNCNKTIINNRLMMMQLRLQQLMLFDRVEDQNVPDDSYDELCHWFSMVEGLLVKLNDYEK